MPTEHNIMVVSAIEENKSPDRYCKMFHHNHHIVVECLVRTVHKILLLFLYSAVVL